MGKLKSKIGLLLAVFYLLPTAVAILFVFDPSDGLNAVPALLLTEPTGMILLSLVNTGPAISSPLLAGILAASAILNASVLYGAGLMISLVIERLGKPERDGAI